MKGKNERKKEMIEIAKKKKCRNEKKNAWPYRRNNGNTCQSWAGTMHTVVGVSLRQIGNEYGLLK